MKGALDETNNWLKVFNEIGYTIFDNQKYPTPFDTILFNSKNKNEIQRWLNTISQEFGKVKEREFVGIHITLKGKLLTYVPDRMKSFEQTNLKGLGLKTINQMYVNNIEGTYAHVMYKSKPTKKDYAEELIILWLNKDDKWNFLVYHIDDEI
jgi:hypothetical protein